MARGSVARWLVTELWHRHSCLCHFKAQASVVFHKYLAVRWWSLRCEIKERGGGDAVASSTTSDAEIAPQPPPARSVAGGDGSSASLSRLGDVPHRPRRSASHLTRRRPQRTVRYL